MRLLLIKYKVNTLAKQNIPTKANKDICLIEVTAIIVSPVIINKSLILTCVNNDRK